MDINVIINNSRTVYKVYHANQTDGKCCIWNNMLLWSLSHWLVLQVYNSSKLIDTTNTSWLATCIAAETRTNNFIPIICKDNIVNSYDSKPGCTLLNFTIMLTFKFTDSLFIYRLNSISEHIHMCLQCKLISKLLMFKYPTIFYSDI